MTSSPDKAAREVGLRVAEARAAAAQGRMAEALESWRRVAALDPAHAEANFHLGSVALFSGDARGALPLLRRAVAGAPGEPLAHLRLAAACRDLGDAEGELSALDGALAAQPYSWIALVQKGALQERLGRPREAARTYGNALKIAPPEAQWPNDQRPALDRARLAVAADREALEAHLRSRLPASEVPLPQRLDEAISVLAGRKKAFVHEPVLLNYPQLPAVPFHDRAHLPWLERLEEATDAIRAEVLELLAEDRPGFQPYVKYPPGVPLNQWAELNFSPRWSTYHLWRNGVPVEENCARCPRTAEVLASLPLARIDGIAPVAVFSALTARTRIPPHTGETNARAIVHLPLIVPPDCGFRVGNVTREWRVGEAWAFDDSIEHEAWNDSDQLRVILILDTWNPYLSPAETARLAPLLRAYHDWYGPSGHQ